MPRDRKITLTDLPVEILDIITEILDESSLSTLARVSRFLGQVVLQRVVRSGTLERVSSHSELVIGPGTPVALIPALVGALWVPKITALVYSAKRHYEGHVLDDLQGISVLLSRIPYGSLQRLRVRIAFDYRCSQKYSFQHWGPPGPRWSRIIERLLGAAISTGCNQIEIDCSNLEGWLFGELYSFSFRQNLVLRVLPYKRIFIQSHNKPPPPAAVGTRSITLNSSPFFWRLSLIQTIRNFDRCARTIQHLTISPTDDKHLHYDPRYEAWLEFGTLAYFPYLKSLSLWAPGNSQMLSRKTLFQFLTRHPNITSLNIDFAIYQREGIYQPVAPDKGEYPILPKLEILAARPQFIPWLVSLTAREKKSVFPFSLFGRKTHRPPFKCVYILTKRMALSALHFETGLLIDAAILSLNDLFPHSDPSSSGSTNDPPTDHYPLVILQINSSHRLWSRETNGRAASVSRITNLTLEIDDSRGPWNWSPRIADWVVTMFPHLQNLEIVGRPFADATVNEQFYNTIKEKCSHLRRFKSDGRLPLWLNREEVQERHQTE